AMVTPAAVTHRRVVQPLLAPRLGATISLRSNRDLPTASSPEPSGKRRRVHELVHNASASAHHTGTPDQRSHDDRTPPHTPSTQHHRIVQRGRWVHFRAFLHEGECSPPVLREGVAERRIAVLPQVVC